MNKKENQNDRLFFVILQMVIFALFFVCSFAQRIPVSDALKLWLYQFLLFEIGAAVLIKIQKWELDRISFYAFSYAFGLIASILLYSLLLFTGLKALAVFVEIIAVILSNYVLIKSSRSIIENSRIAYGYVLIYISILFLICFFAVTLRDSLPAISGGTYYYNDQLFWIGNTLSFTKGFPLNDFRLVGQPFYYHHFSSIVIANISLMTGIDVVAVSLFYSSYIPCMLMVLSSYALLREFVKKDGFIAIGILLVLFTEGITKITSWHLYFLPFGFDYGYAFGMLTIALLMKMIETEDYGVKNIFSTCLFIAVTTGFKGPVAVVVLMGFACISLHFLIENKWKEGFVFGGLWLLTFLLVYIFIVSGMLNPVKSENGLLYVGLIEGFDRNRYAVNIYGKMVDSLGIASSKILKLVALVLFVYESNRSCTTLLVVGIIAFLLVLIKKKSMDLPLFIGIGICVWGILLTLVTYQNGNSQLYFIMSIIPFGIASGLYALERVYLNNKKAFAVILIIVFMGSTLDFLSFADVAKGKMVSGFSVFQGSFESNTLEYLYTNDDVELCSWIKNNTKDNDYIAIDSFEYQGLKKEELLGVFSERFIWNDGEYSVNKEELKRRREIVDGAITGDAGSIAELKKEGVNYLVFTSALNDGNVLEKNGYISLFKNNSYQVFALK